eukprot:6214217-Pleurochrysis_carterae.AAC.2
METPRNHPRGMRVVMYGKHLPNSCRIAQIVLSQPSSASAAERNWSIYGTIKLKIRNRLSHETSDKLVYANEALHLRQKLQDAKYIQHTAAWDGDSESNDVDIGGDFSRYTI